MIPAPQSTAELDALISRPSPQVIETVRHLPEGIAVLGAGGKMGFHVALMLQNALAACGRHDPVMAVSRFSSPVARKQFEDAGFDVRSADLSNPDDVSQLPVVPNVIFLAGIKFGTSANPDMLHRMNVQMPTLVAEHYRDSRICALSTGCVYSFTSPASGGSTEESETDPPGDYAQSCLGREQAFVNASAKYGTRCALIRLNYSIDLRYGVLVDIAQRVQSGLPVNVDMGYVNVIWQGDAVKHVIQSLAHVSAPPLILNVTGPEILRVRDLAHQFAEQFGQSAIIEGQETETAWLNNAAKSHGLFGRPDISIEQMVAWISDWLRNGRELLGKPTHFEVRDGAY